MRVSSATSTVSYVISDGKIGLTPPTTPTTPTGGDGKIGLIPPSNSTVEGLGESVDSYA